MTLNASARITRLFIGDKDYSSCFISFQGSDSHLDGSGLITFTGSIALGRTFGFDESLDDRRNSRFFRGQTIAIDIQDSQGNFRKHPRGALRIVSSKYEEDSQRLTIDVGDLTALLNFREPTDVSKTEIKLGSDTPSGTVIIRMLHAAGITSISGTLPGTRINYPINLTGSYLANAGKLLYANNLFGWIDKNEIFQVRAAKIIAAAPAVTFAIGKDEIWYKRLDTAESPCEIVKAVGRCVVVRPAVFRDDTTEQYGSAVLVDKDAASSTPITVKKTRIKEDWLPGQKILTTTTTTLQPVGLVIPKELITTASKLSLINSEIKIEKIYYEQNGEGKLKQKVSNIYQLAAPSILEFALANKNSFVFNIFALAESFYNSYSFKYDTKDRLSEITTKTSEIAGNLLSGTDEDWAKWTHPPTFLTDSEYKVEGWEETTKGIWEYEYYSYQPLIKVKPELAEVKPNETGTRGPTSNKLDMLYASGERQTSNSGQLAPAAPEREPAEFTSSEEDLEEKMTFAIPGSGNNLRPRERTFTVDFLAGLNKSGLARGELELSLGEDTIANSQLRAIALREGRLLWGRYKGQEIAVVLTDAWFDYYPLLNIKSVERDGTEQAFLADGCSWVVGQTRVLVSCDGIWLGTWQTPQTPTPQAPNPEPEAEPFVVPPYDEIHTLNAGFGFGATFNAFPYDAITITATAESGLGLACGTWLAISGIHWSDLEWDAIADADWDEIADDDF